MKGLRVTVVGLGLSGRAAARLLVRNGATVTVSDRRSAAELEAPMASMKDVAVRYEVGGHSDGAFQGVELIVMSPGIPKEVVAPIRAAEKRGVPVIGEVELAFRMMTAPVAAITGTNGKSTTTALLGEMIRQSGRRVFIGGNLGRPLCEAALEPVEWDWIVAELSSFQLETIQSFRPRVAVLLNVTPNHLDRYRTLDVYRTAKMRLFENQTAADAAVINADDPAVLSQAVPIRARRVGFGRTPRPEAGVYFESGAVVAVGLSKAAARVEILRRDEIPLPGSHNLENVMAASAAGLLCDCPMEGIRSAIRGFKGLEHRLETVRERYGVRYVNDSKATTDAALAKALESMSGPIVLIAGGRNKGAEFEGLRDLVGRRVKTAVLIGEARAEIRAAWSGVAPLFETGSLEEAVRVAARTATSGDVVLLSPACASYDMFRDFEHRGKRFKEIVNGL